MSQEIEVKVLYPALDELRETLESLGAICTIERTHEWNTRYDTDAMPFADDDQVMRLRRDNRVRLTYKGASQTQQGIIEREELEVEVNDFDTMEQILAKIGFHDMMHYEKYRTTYEYDETEIVLDEMPYGNFVEIEGDTQAIERVLEALGLQDVERREHSYAELFDYVKHHLDLDFRDLTFENFERIDVPESAFIPPGSIVIR